MKTKVMVVFVIGMIGFQILPSISDVFAEEDLELTYDLFSP